MLEATLKCKYRTINLSQKYNNVFKYKCNFFINSRETFLEFARVLAIALFLLKNILLLQNVSRIKQNENKNQKTKPDGDVSPLVQKKLCCFW